MSSHIKKCKEKGQRFPEELILNWFSQIMLGLKYIHRHNILHRDLKSSNIFLQENGDLKIGDFGIARVLEGTLQNAETVVGTPYYISPEICRSEPYSFKSDVWSLGCVLYELCTLDYPFRGMNLLNLVHKIVHEDPAPIPPQYSSELSDLIGLLLRKKLEERPTLDQVMQIEFVKWFLVGFMNTDQAEEEKRETFLTLSDRDAPHQKSIDYRAVEKRSQYSNSAHNPYTQERNRTRITSYDQLGPNQYQTAYNSSQKYADLTPMEKLKIRKEMEVKRREEEMKKAIRQDSGLGQYQDLAINGKKFGEKSMVGPKKDKISSVKRLEGPLQEDVFSQNKKSALKVNGQNVITNFESELAKSIKHFEAEVQSGESPLVDSKLSRDPNASRASYMNTIRQNLEETIQSQFFPEVKQLSFSKVKSVSKTGPQPEEKEDFPPDFEEVAEEFAKQLVHRLRRHPKHPQRFLHASFQGPAQWQAGSAG